MSAPHYFELLQWNDAATSNPDTDLTVAVWSTEHGLLTAWWDDAQGVWMDCATGGTIVDVTHWADPKGPREVTAVPAADVPVDQVRAALGEALELLRGWIDHKCPRRYKDEHLAVLKVLAEAGGLLS